MPFTRFEAYEQFLYALPEGQASVLHSTLVLIRRGHAVATVRGEIHFAMNIRLVVREQLLALPRIEITDYGYEVWRKEELLYWYDSQPHPDHSDLASTHPHHKHVPPDIKHHRIPAPGLSLARPNLPFLIDEIERELLADT